MEVETGNVNITDERQGKEKQTSPQVCITHKALLFPLSLAQREACKLQECERRAAFKNLWEGTVICYDVLRPTRPNSWTDKNEQNSRNHTNNHVTRERYRNTQNRARRVTKSEQICSEEPLGDSLTVRSHWIRFPLSVFFLGSGRRSFGASPCSYMCAWFWLAVTVESEVWQYSGSNESCWPHSPSL